MPISLKALEVVGVLTEVSVFQALKEVETSYTCQIAMDELKKLVVVGDGFAGKTALLFAFTHDKFEDGYEPTVFETMSVYVQLDNKKEINLSLWDTAGQDDYDRLRPLSYPDTDVILLCYSVDSLSSFANIKEKWTLELGHFCFGVPFLLIANKKDLRDELYQRTPSDGEGDDVQRPLDAERKSGCSMVTWEEGQELAREIQAHAFFECSSKTRENVKEVFIAAVRASLKTKRKLNTRRRCTVL